MNVGKPCTYAMNFLRIFRLHLTNFSAFTAIQAVSYLIPLATIPYFARVLTISGMGQIAIASAVGLAGGVLMDYGVLQSGARYAAINSSDSQALNRYLIASTALKLLLLSGLFSAFLIGTLVVPAIRENVWVYFWALISAATTSLFPIWLYQGLLIVPKAARILVTTRFLAAGASVALIRSPADTYVVPMTQAITGCISLFAAGIYFRRLLPLRLSGTVLADAKRMLVDNWNLFSATKWGIVHAYGSIFIVGIMLPLQSVGFYSIAEKISQAFVSIFNIGAQTAFPTFVRRFAKNLDDFASSVKLYLITVSIISFVMLVLLFIGRYEIYSFFAGEKNTEGVTVFTIWLFASFFTVTSVSLTPIMVAMHRDDSLASIYRFTGLTFLVGAPLLVYFYGVIGMALAAFYPQSFIAIYLLVAVKRSLKVSALSGSDNIADRNTSIL